LPRDVYAPRNETWTTGEIAVHCGLSDVATEGAKLRVAIFAQSLSG
jgi:hypothetical protein